MGFGKEGGILLVRMWFMRMRTLIFRIREIYGRGSKEEFSGNYGKYGIFICLE